jgi:pyruvate formate lyase activating enzyme
MELPFFGRLSALAVDPIEKKPLYHFRPGSAVLSAGFVGCNLRCPFCQNWSIAQGTDQAGGFVAPADLAAAARGGPGALAYTYSEPLVHFEYLLAAMAAARAAGVANVLVTNGMIAAEPAARLFALTDAANIDLKCWSPAGYAQTLGGDLDTVRRTVALALAAGVHVELTTLIVPGFNDSAAEVAAIAEWTAGLSPDLPLHLSAYHPAYRYDAPPTPASLIAERALMARGFLRFVYAGNVGGYSDTLCGSCGQALVRRNGYRIDRSGLSSDASGIAACVACGARAPIIVAGEGRSETAG